ncbi:MAG TPA: hypothetical protein VHX43_05175 [Xanthobacteraceae bacterium]|jgi:hypothetical protein|nr:hypothetical protein [Xanthobacteraceae bacterium]
MFESKRVEWRIEEAKRTTKRVVDHAVDLLWLSESNAITLYSDALAKQIPRSYAAHAFNVFRKAMHQIEIVRLCALWDTAKLDRETIPTVIELIDHPDVLAQLSETVRAQYVQVVPSRGTDVRKEDSDAEVINFYHAKTGSERAERAFAELQDTIKQSRVLQESRRLKAVRSLRNNHVAHNLTQEAKKKAGQVEPVKLGDERTVLGETLPIIKTLYSWVNGVGFSFEASQKIDRKCAEELWQNCTFTIGPGRPRLGSPP